MNYILYFFVFSFFGWCIETAWASFCSHRFISKQTLLKSPLCPVYGNGAIAMIAVLMPVSDSILLTFCGGFFIASCVEYLTSLYYEHFFGISWWDYSQNAANIHGRVCAKLSLIWGIISVIFFRFLFPPVKLLAENSSGYLKLIISILLLTFFITDYKNTLSEIKKYVNGEISTAENRFAALKIIQ